MQYSPLISELIPKEDLEGVFLVKFLSLQTDKKGKSYLNIILCDKSGEIEARLWENAAETFERIQQRDIVRVSAKVNLYQGRKQLVLNAIQSAPPGAYPADRFTAASSFSPERMHQDLLAIVATMQDAKARALAQLILEDAELKPRILRAPAAKTIHHAYAGGLLEHVLSICRIMNFLGDHYGAYYGKALNKDLLFLGAIFHDIGKLEELDWEQGTEYSHSGRLIGHLVQGCELVDRFISRIPDFPEDLRLQIKHQILAHHGKLEFGSPKVPVTVEALLVHYIDDLDSKINSIYGFLEKDPTPGAWSTYNKLYERVFLRPAVPPRIQGSSPGIP